MKYLDKYIAGAARRIRLRSAVCALLALVILTLMVPMAQADDNVISILFVGEDNAAERAVAGNAQWGRADAIIVATLNLDNGKIHLLSIDREYPIELERQGVSKLNLACYFGGPALVMEKVNELFDLDLSMYASVTKKEMQDVVGLVGKVDIYISQDDLYINKRFKEPGWYSLTQKEVISYMSARSQDSDIMRNARQRAVMTAVLKQVMAMKPSDALTLLTKTMAKVDTNMDPVSAMQMALAIMAHGYTEPLQMRSPETVESTVINSNRVTVVEDMEAEKARIHAFLYGDE